MSNIIQFPKGKMTTPPQSIDEVIEAVNESRKEFLDFMTEDFISFIVMKSYSEGFDLAENEQNYYLMRESIRSSLYGSAGIDHELQDLAEEAFSEVEIEIEFEPLDSDAEDDVEST